MLCCNKRQNWLNWQMKGKVLKANKLSDLIISSITVRTSLVQALRYISGSTFYQTENKDLQKGIFKKHISLPCSHRMEISVQISSLTYRLQKSQIPVAFVCASVYMRKAGRPHRLNQSTHTTGEDSKKIPRRRAKRSLFSKKKCPVRRVCSVYCTRSAISAARSVLS